MSLVGQYEMDLFTAIFSLLYVPIPDLQLEDYIPVEVCSSCQATVHYLLPACMPDNRYMHTRWGSLVAK